MTIPCYFQPRQPVLWLWLLFFLALPVRVRAQGPGPAFDRAATCGQPASGSRYVPVRLAVDAAGSAYVAGYFSGTVVFGTTILQTTGPIPSPVGGLDYDWFVAKLDPLGVPVWACGAGRQRPATAARTCAWTGSGTCSWPAWPRTGPVSGRTA